MRTLVRTTFLAITAAMSGCGSDKTPSSMAEVVGIYMGSYGGGVESFEIKADGSFAQTFRVGTNVIYNATGKWNITNRLIHFGPFMSPDGMWDGKFDGKPDSTQGAPGTWYRGPIRIEFTEWPYHVAKVKGEGATAAAPTAK